MFIKEVNWSRRWAIAAIRSSTLVLAGTTMALFEVGVPGATPEGMPLVKWVPTDVWLGAVDRSGALETAPVLPAAVLMVGTCCKSTLL